MPIKKIESLEIEPEAKHINKTFLYVQRIGIILMALIMLAAFLGVFGKGLFTLTSRSQGTLTISYERFIRKQAATFYHIKIHSNLNSKAVKFWIDPSFYKKLAIKNINPIPSFEDISDNKILYTFNTNNSDLIEITLQAEPEKMGMMTTRMGLSEEEQIQLKQLIYP